MTLEVVACKEKENLERDQVEERTSENEHQDARQEISLFCSIATGQNI